MVLKILGGGNFPVAHPLVADLPWSMVLRANWHWAVEIWQQSNRMDPIFWIRYTTGNVDLSNPRKQRGLLSLPINNNGSLMGSFALKQALSHASYIFWSQVDRSQSASRQWCRSWWCKRTSKCFDLSKIRVKYLKIWAKMFGHLCFLFVWSMSLTE